MSKWPSPEWVRLARGVKDGARLAWIEQYEAATKTEETSACGIKWGLFGTLRLMDRITRERQAQTD